MTLRFSFRFKGMSEAIEIPHAKLAAEHPSLAKLRAHIGASARAAEERAGRDPSTGRVANLADQAFAGFLARCLRGFGHDYVERVNGALERIYRARENIGEELDAALQGKLPEFNKIRNAFEEIDAAFPEIIDPDSAHPPKVSPMGEGVPLTSKAQSLPDFLKNSANRLTQSARNTMERADKLEPKDLGEVLEATRWPKSVGRARAQVEALVEKLRTKGFSQTAVNQFLAALEEWSLPDEMRKASDDAIDGLTKENVKRPAALQKALRASVKLRAMFKDNPEQFHEWWEGYNNKRRPYGFGLYCWFRTHHVRGALGEWTTAFHLGRNKYLLFLKGPKANVTTGGTDMLVVDVRTGEIYAIDNKATLRTRILEKVTALMRNFSQNLAADIQDLRNAMGERSEPQIEGLIRRMEAAERRIRAVESRLGLSGEALKEALDKNVDVAMPDGSKQPVQSVITGILQESGIQRVITNSGGVLEAVGGHLDEAGIDFADLNEPMVKAATVQGED